MTTLILFIYGIAYGLNIVSLVRACTITLPVSEKCSHGQMVRGNDCGRRYNRMKKREGRPSKLDQNDLVSGETAEVLAKQHGVSS